MAISTGSTTSLVELTTLIPQLLIGGDQTDIHVGGLPEDDRRLIGPRFIIPMSRLALLSLLTKTGLEFHWPGYQYMGTGTKLVIHLKRGDSGINRLD